MSILKWLGGNDTGMSSKALALAALGEMPKRPAYPHDGADIGRCFRLIDTCPEAESGLQKLATDGGPYWAALAGRWADLRVAYDADVRDRGGRTYALMQTLLRPIEDTDPRFLRMGDNASIMRGAQ